MSSGDARDHCLAPSRSMGGPLEARSRGYDRLSPELTSLGGEPDGLLALAARGHTPRSSSRGQRAGDDLTLRNQIPGLIGVNPRGDKVARARAVAPDVEAGHVDLPAHPTRRARTTTSRIPRIGCGSSSHECASFPNAAHNDQVDALSQALMRLQARRSGYRMKGGRGRSPARSERRCD